MQHGQVHVSVCVGDEAGVKVNVWINIGTLTESLEIYGQRACDGNCKTLSDQFNLGWYEFDDKYV